MDSTSPGAARFSVDKTVVLLWCLTAAKLMIALAGVHPLFELHRDELLYVAEARHLAWGYLEAPPLLSLLAWLSGLIGPGEIWIRLWPALFGSLTFWITGKIVIGLGGKGFALCLVFLSFIFSAFLRTHFLFQPNFLDIFFWTWCAYLLFQYIRNEDNRLIYFFGIAAGLGLLSKYSMAIFLLALLFALAFSAHRTVFRKKQLYLSMGICLLILLPNLIWQYQTNFPVTYHMEELHDKQLRYIQPVTFLTEQFLMTLPVCFLWLTGLWFVFRHPAGRPYRVFGWTFLLILLLLLLFKGKAYYALGIYPVLFAFGVFYFEAICRTRSWVRYGGLAFIVLTGIPTIPILLPVFAPDQLAAYYRFARLEDIGLLQWEDRQNHALPQDFADMLGRRELAQKTTAAFKKIPGTQQVNTVIFCDNYGQAGGLNFYGPPELPEAVSASASFLLWIPEYQQIDHVIWIGEPPPPESGLESAFNEVIVLDSITTPLSREFGTRIKWYRNADTLFTTRFNQAINQLRGTFTRP